MGACVSVSGKFLKKTRYIKNPLNEDCISYGNQNPKSKLKTPRNSHHITLLKNVPEVDVFTRYNFGNELGRGEFGVTYQCYDSFTGESVACKKISKSKIKTEIDVEDVRREVEIMRNLPSHPNIVRYKDVYGDKDAVYLVMELCHGGELFDRIVSRGHYTERGAATTTKTIMEGVKAIVSAKSLAAPTTWPPKSLNVTMVRKLMCGARVSFFTSYSVAFLPFGRAIIKCEVDFKRDPWPKVSDDAKDLVQGMLDPNPYTRMTVEEVLENVRARIKQFSLMNKFKKKVLRVVADNLPQEQIAGIKQMFHMMDTDKNGNLTFEELKDGLQMIGHPVADPDVQMLMDAADVDGNGMLNCEEFVTMSVHLKKIGGGDEQLRQAFQYFDKDGSGFIEIEELKQGLLDDNLGPNNDKVIQDIIFDVDLDKDGRISYHEFATMMTTGVEWRMASRQYSRAMLNALSMRLFKDKSLVHKN
ncbi:Calcium-dependent protein kinase [Actinidia chinensis var. chinensis]|uniref:non-specific serine/threonine protein kinase n=1 Tax=Actinidia chinensis var. chinensis TaxID=1590841 RepID=A0A2R6S0U8_ACTCC|nr:Calcium-dependent protein kinase [Actinidia chinensis var. chinensis]